MKVERKPTERDINRHLIRIFIHSGGGGEEPGDDIGRSAWFRSIPFLSRG
jgi:hypothetical protein